MDWQPPLTVLPRHLLRPRHPPPMKSHCSHAPPPPPRSPPVTRKQRRVPNRLSVSVATESLPLVDSSRRLSLDLTALAKIGGEGTLAVSGAVAIGDETCVPMFERGRFYEVYAARRNERLRMRKREIMAAGGERAAGDLGVVAMELARRRISRKAGEAVRRSVQAEELPLLGRSRTPRSPVGAARSGKEIRFAPCFAAAPAVCQRPPQYRV